MSLNFQDVIRDVHNPSTHSLQTSSGGATIFAVVNTGAATDSVLNIGFATVSVSNPTLYAVVNTGAAGIGNSIVTINPRTDYIGLMSVSGNVAISNATLYAVVNTQATASSNITLDPGSKTGIVGNITLSDPKTYIGSVSVSGSVGLNSGIAEIGFATVSVSNPTLYAVVNTGAVGVGNSMVTINPRTDYIGLVSVSGNVDVSSLPATPTGTNYVGLVTVDVGTIKSWADPKTYLGLVSVQGNVAVSSLPETPVGTKFIGLATVWNANQQALVAGIAGIGFATVSLGAGNSNVGDVDVASIAAGTNYIGLVTAVNGLAWPDPKTWIGLVTADLAHAWVDPTTYIGLVTVGHTVTVDAHALTASTVNIGSVSVLGGTIGATLAASPAFVGIVTIANQQALIASVAKIGFATVNVAGMSALVASNVNIGSVSILGGGIGLTASTVNVGSVSVLGGGIGLNAGVNNIGFATVTLSGAGNPSVFAVNVGTNKTLLNMPIGFSTASVVTVAVPATNTSVKITNMLLNSDATVRFTIKSGVTYLTGNASIGITLNPGGGFIMTGSPDSPSWIGLPSGALVVEKLDLTATSAKIAGNVVYFAE